MAPVEAVALAEHTSARAKGRLPSDAATLPVTLTGAEGECADGPALLVGVGVSPEVVAGLAGFSVCVCVTKAVDGWPVPTWV